MTIKPTADLIWTEHVRSYVAEHLHPYAHRPGTMQHMDDAFTLLRQAVDLLPEDAVAENGQLRPMWDIGNRTADGERELSIARLWVEFTQKLGPGETADVRLAPLRPEQWRHVKCGDVITMHEARPVAGTATVIEVLPPRA